jgi:hypothetical protein
METSRDIQLARALAERYLEACADPDQQRRREVWTAVNSLVPMPPPLYMRLGVCINEVVAPAALECESPFWRRFEHWFKTQLFVASLWDDSVLEPWLPLRAVFDYSGWGVEVKHIPPPTPGGSWMYDPPLKTEADLDNLVVPRHSVNEAATQAAYEQLADGVGDLIPIEIDRSPAYQVWTADLSTDLAHLRGLEQMMVDMVDRPQWLHRLLAFMRDGVLKAQQEAEDAGHWRLSSHQNQAMPYCKELAPPQAGSPPVNRSRLWCFLAAQELTLVSPAMHEEFMFNYQRPILEKFGLVSYGCCEDLTRKIAMVKQLPNLRRIAVAPRADLAACAEQAAGEYTLSWRPSPADTVCVGFNEEAILKLLRKGLEEGQGHPMDITLKDVQTVQNQPWRLRRFVELTRRAVDRYWRS